MRYFYIAMLVLCIILLIVLITCLIIHIRKQKAYKKVMCMTHGEKVRQLDKAMDPFGFKYVGKGDLVGSGMNPWQREMGFCRQYDEHAPAMHMIIDSEPIYFNYDKKRWLVELWKGQYGMTTGGEVGIYVNEEADFDIPPDKIFYECAMDKDRMPMYFRLWKRGRIIMERSECHWWLTGFEVGEYSKKEELSMDVRICFPNEEMRDAFCFGLKRAGYKKDEVCIDGNGVSVRFDRPHTKQPKVYCKLYLAYVNCCNRRKCYIYKKQTKWVTSTLDKITFIGYCFPLLYHLLMKIGVKCTPKKMRKYRKRKIKVQKGET
ncbi:DUF4474 domain-containing protein [Lachnospiraceae bacterium OttesenSCG-928-D06]|nr:DUF4474 domain-containing protein [Lachnospiraceae bacterium OttesenSCG-928-D06]